MEPGEGYDPSFGGPKPPVLPLNDPGIIKVLIVFEPSHAIHDPAHI